MSTRSELFAKERARKKRVARIKSVSVLFVITALIATSVYFLPRIKAISIEQINVSGNEAVEAADITSVAEGILRGTYLHVLPKNNIFIYPKAFLENAVVTSNPRIKTAAVSFATFKSISISITERKPQALYCQHLATSNETSASSSPSTSDLSESCFYIDETGYIYAPSPDFSGSVFVKYVSTSTENMIGKFLMDKAQFSAFLAFTERMKKDFHGINTIAIDSSGTAHATLAEGGVLLFGETQDLGAVADNFETLIGSKEFKGKNSDGMFQFKYIDLRYGNKIFYKI